MSFSNVNQIILCMIKPLFSRKLYKHGLYEILKILKITVGHISANDITLTSEIFE